MRKQYHLRVAGSAFDAWDVDRLVALVADVPVEEIPLADIADIDREYWYDHGYRPTVRSIVEHARLIGEVDLGYPIVVDPDGHVMDGMHRVARALLDGRPTIAAKRLRRMPDPDYPSCQPDELPYP